MVLDYILLSMLREPATGYDLRKAFEEGAQHFWSAELSQIYPALKRMTAAGWLTRAPAPSKRGPRRMVYRRTDLGKSELEAWLRSEPLGGRERIPYIAQLIALGELDDLDATDTFLARLQDQLEQKLAILSAAEEETLAEAGGSTDNMDAETFHEYISLRMGLAAFGARVRSCEENRVLLQRRMSAAHV
jgi:DNA-binding PadR family transcriptional regulator